jgi:hypothetical protein
VTNPAVLLLQLLLLLLAVCVAAIVSQAVDTSRHDVMLSWL